jgi:hypothetical protein
MRQSCVRDELNNASRKAVMIAKPCDEIAYRVQPHTEATLDFSCLKRYSSQMIKSARIVNRKHMSRFGWAVEGVVR